MTELLNEISPIEDFNNTRYELNFVGHEFREPKYSESECRELEKTYASALYVTAQLKIKQTGEIKENQIFLADIPFMTTNGTFIINGAERVVVSQLVRSPGVYFTVEEDPVTGRKMGNAKFVPYRGAWLEFETSSRDIISVKVDRKRRIPVTTFLRAIGFDSPQAILDEFKSFDTDTDHTYIKTTLDRDPNAIERKDALIELYRHIRPGEPPTLENSEAMLHNLFFNPRRYDLGRVGRYKVNKRLGGDYNIEDKTLTKSDIIAVVKKILDINNGRETPDDIDHLGNRRVRAVGELIQNQLRVGLVRMERVVKERMTINDPETTTPSSLINQRPVGAAVREFFGGSQLSQFMDQTNPLAELTHKRRLSALGPGGLSRERAGFDVRDVHHSHYGRICPIETPEGPNIGLLGSLATYARTNEFGFIETPYRTVVHELQSHDGELIGRTINEPVRDDQGKTIIRKGSVVTNRTFAKLSSLPEMNIKVQAYVTDKPEHIHYLSADDEEKFVIAQANAVLDEKGQISSEKIEVRRGEDFAIESPDQIDYMDISPKQIVSVSTALIPFLEHDDANRALMGSNMQRQAVPLLRPDAPIVSTGMERRVAIDSGQVVISDVDGEVTVCGSDYIAIRDNQGKDYEYQLRKFFRTNQGTCMNQRPIVFKGDKVYAGQPIADSSSTDGGRLALGQNVLVAFMSWEGYNFEDAIIVSERLLQEDKFTSIHIEKHECEARDTKIGPEEITRDIPNVGEESLRNLDEDGIIMPGAEVGPGDILVGKITPKGETDLSAEEKLLRAIFGEKARDVKDSSLRVPHGERGKVTKVSIFSRDNGDDLPAGANKLVRVWIAQTRKISVGDKMAGRHGNKGVISRIMPVEDMPYTADGPPVDIILNPLGVPSRMNLGQVLETHLGWACTELGDKIKDLINKKITDYHKTRDFPSIEGTSKISPYLKFGQLHVETIWNSCQNIENKNTGYRTMSINTKGNVIFSAEWRHLQVFEYGPIDAPDLDISSHDISFPEIGVGDKDTIQLILKSNGSEAIEFEYDYFSHPDFTTPSILNTLDPGDSIIVNVVYTKSGNNASGVYNIPSNDNDEPIITCEVLGNYDGVNVGMPAPDFTLPTAANGTNNFNLTQHWSNNGEIVVITFFSPG